MAAAAPPRSSAVVLTALRAMKDDFRAMLFIEFERLMCAGRMIPLRKVVALSFFHMRREVSSILDGELIGIERLGVTYLLTDLLRDDIQAKIVGVNDAWFSADVRGRADIDLIQGIFDVAIGKFLHATDDKVDDAGPDETRGMCIVCMDSVAELVYLPCGHACSCRACYDIMVDAAGLWGIVECPACRERVRDTEPFTSEQRLKLLAGDEVHHSRGSRIFVQADAKRSFSVMGDVYIPGFA
jgi:Zinc finger, C3HC4 type (RING finger)